MTTPVKTQRSAPKGCRVETSWLRKMVMPPLTFFSDREANQHHPVPPPQQRSCPSKAGRVRFLSQGHALCHEPAFEQPYLQPTQETCLCSIFFKDEDLQNSEANALLGLRQSLPR